MALDEGLKLGPYEILAPLGAGGMGEVYLANDSCLDRQVAIKALPDHLARDPDRLSRFEREAKTLATLNHPNVAGIYGVEEQDGRKYLVLEYVDGETLAERIARGPLPVDEALEICTQIGAGVEAAHEAGVIHRDLKPANVKITPEGKVKVLDFGLAKVAGGTASSSFHQAETVTSPVYQAHSPTMPGVILGTAAYMSPEQARGRTVDKRTDIWSFGVVLYECLTGANPFVGETVSDSIGAILHKDLDLNGLPSEVPANVQRVLRRCLERDNANRYRDIGDACLDLRHRSENTNDNGQAPRSRAPWVIAAAGVAVGAVGLIAAMLPRTTAPTMEMRFSIASDVSTILLHERFAIAPDGSAVAYIDSQGRLLLRRLDEFEPIVLYDGRDSRSVFFSPDGLWVGFWSEGQVRKVPVKGGAPVSIVRTPQIRGASWGDAGEIVLSQVAGGVKVVSELGGKLRDALADEAILPNFWAERPVMLPGGAAALFYWSRGVAAIDLRSGVVSLLVPGATQPQFVPPDRLVYLREDATVWCIPFDPDTTKILGDPVLVWQEPVDSYVASANGTFVFLPERGDDARRRLVWVDRDGNVDPLPLEEQDYLHPRFSPDQTRVAVTIQKQLGNDRIWIADLLRGVQRSLNPEGHGGWPVWTQNGERIVHASFAPGSEGVVIARAANGSDEPGHLDFPQRMAIPISWCEATQMLAFYAYGQQADIWIARGDEPPQPFAVTSADERAPVLSPDGRWLAFVSDETGRDEVHVRDVPDAAIRIIASTTGGTEPRWSPDGKELFYRRGGQMFAVLFDPESPRDVGAPQILFDDSRLAVSPIGRGNPNYDIGSDGRFLMVQNAAAEDLPGLRVVLHWGNRLYER